MSYYRTIDIRMWGDSRFRSLSKPQPNAQTLWQFLLTGPHTTSLPGLSSSGEAAMAEILEWSMKPFRESFTELAAAGMVKADWSARVVFVPKAITYNHPRNHNVVKSWGRHFDAIPECVLKVEAYQAFKLFIESFHEQLAESFLKSFREPTSNRISISNSNRNSICMNDSANHSGEGTGVKGKDVTPCFCQEVVTVWNPIPGIKPVRQLTYGLHKRLHARKAEMPTVDAWRDYLKIIAASAFLTGKVPGMNGQGSFRATLDWVAGPENMDKILQGKYDDVRTPRPPRKLLGSEYADVT